MAAFPIYEYFSEQAVSVFDLTMLIKFFMLQWYIIEGNKSEKAKLIIKIIRLFLFTMIYIHSTACIFFYVINTDQEWHPPQAKYADDFMIFY